MANSRGIDRAVGRRSRGLLFGKLDNSECIQDETGAGTECASDSQHSSYFEDCEKESPSKPLPHINCQMLTGKFEIERPFADHKMFRILIHDEKTSLHVQVPEDMKVLVNGPNDNRANFTPPDSVGPVMNHSMSCVQSQNELSPDLNLLVRNLQCLEQKSISSFQLQSTRFLKAMRACMHACSVPKYLMPISRYHNELIQELIDDFKSRLNHGDSGQKKARQCLFLNTEFEKVMQQKSSSSYDPYNSLTDTRLLTFSTQQIESSIVENAPRKRFSSVFDPRVELRASEITLQLEDICFVLDGSECTVKQILKDIRSELDRVCIVMSDVFTDTQDLPGMKLKDECNVNHNAIKSWQKAFKLVGTIASKPIYPVCALKRVLYDFIQSDACLCHNDKTRCFGTALLQKVGYNKTSCDEKCLTFPDEIEMKYQSELSMLVLSSSENSHRLETDNLKVIFEYEAPIQNQIKFLIQELSSFHKHLGVTVAKDTLCDLSWDDIEIIIPMILKGGKLACVSEKINCKSVTDRLRVPKKMSGNPIDATDSLTDEIENHLRRELEESTYRLNKCTLHLDKLEVMLAKYPFKLKEVCQGIACHFPKGCIYSLRSGVHCEQIDDSKPKDSGINVGYVPSDTKKQTDVHQVLNIPNIDQTSSILSSSSCHRYVAKAQKQDNTFSCSDVYHHIHSEQAIPPKFDDLQSSLSHRTLHSSLSLTEKHVKNWNKLSNSLDTYCLVQIERSSNNRCNLERSPLVDFDARLGHFLTCSPVRSFTEQLKEINDHIKNVIKSVKKRISIVDLMQKSIWDDLIHLATPPKGLVEHNGFSADARENLRGYVFQSLQDEKFNIVKNRVSQGTYPENSVIGSLRVVPFCKKDSEKTVFSNATCIPSAECTYKPKSASDSALRYVSSYCNQAERLKSTDSKPCIELSSDLHYHTRRKEKRIGDDHPNNCAHCPIEVEECNHLCTSFYHSLGTRFPVYVIDGTVDCYHKVFGHFASQKSVRSLNFADCLKRVCVLLKQKNNTVTHGVNTNAEVSSRWRSTFGLLQSGAFTNHVNLAAPLLIQTVHTFAAAADPLFEIKCQAKDISSKSEVAYASDSIQKGRDQQKSTVTVISSTDKPNTGLNDLQTEYHKYPTVCCSTIIPSTWLPSTWFSKVVHFKFNLHVKNLVTLVFLLLLAATLSPTCSGMSSNCNSSFIICPSSQVVSVGEEALFRCRHPTADFIGWFVNESLVGTNPPPDIFAGTVQDNDGNTVHTLTIAGRPEYNGTTVVCAAVYLDGRPSEPTPEALLQVITPPPTTPPPTTPPPTTPLPTTYFPLGEFAVSPVDEVVAQEQHAVFNCQHSTAHSIGWRLNGIPLLDTSLVGVEARSTSLPGGVLNTLTIEARPEYNLTNIECVATFFDDSPSEATGVVKLTIQGQLDAITTLVRIPSNITWVPPFSLDLTDIDPDIIYCIEVFFIDCGVEYFVLRDSNVTTNYYDNERLDPNFTYKITVTPRSNVIDALPGNSTVLKEKYNVLSNEAFVSVNSITSIEKNLTVDIHIEAAVNSIEPASYTLSLDPLDGLSDPDTFSSLPVTVIKNKDKDIIVLRTSLPRYRLWLCIVFPNNCSQSNNYPIPNNMEVLSTHDIQNVSLSSLQPGEIEISGDFVEGTNATGALVIVYSQTDGRTHYHLAPRAQSKRLEARVVADLRGAYMVSIFTMQENGLPFERVVTTPAVIESNIASNDETETENVPHVIEYELASNPDGVNVTCHFLDSSTTKCVVVVHSLISTSLNSSGLMDISSYLLNRSAGDDSANCVIKGVNLEEYQFGVIGGELKMEDSVPTYAAENCGISCSFYAAIGISIIFVILMALVLIALMLARFKKRRLRPFEVSVETAMKNENIYTRVELKTLVKANTSEPQDSAAYQNIAEVYDEPTSTHHSVTVRESALNEPSTLEKSQESGYASITCTPSSKRKLDGCAKEDETKVIYSGIRHDWNENSGLDGVRNVVPLATLQEENDVPAQMSFTIDNLYDQLWSLRSKWQEIGKAMSLPEDLLDEIDTNNETDESCLRNVLEFYMQKCDLQHTWEEMHSFVKIVDENLADKIYCNHIQPYINSNTECSQMQDKEKTDINDIPDMNDINDTPDMKDTKETPSMKHPPDMDTPDKDNNPDMKDTPDINDQPDVQDSPDRNDQPDTKDTRDMNNTPVKLMLPIPAPPFIPEGARQSNESTEQRQSVGNLFTETSLESGRIDLQNSSYNRDCPTEFFENFAPQHYHSFPCLQRSLEYYQVEGDSYWCGVRSTSSPAVVLEMESTSPEGPNVGVCSEDEVKSETSRMAINTSIKVPSQTEKEADDLRFPHVQLEASLQPHSTQPTDLVKRFDVTIEETRPITIVTDSESDSAVSSALPLCCYDICNSSTPFHSNKATVKNSFCYLFYNIHYNEDVEISQEIHIDEAIAIVAVSHSQPSTISVKKKAKRVQTKVLHDTEQCYLSKRVAVKSLSCDEALIHSYPVMFVIRLQGVKWCTWSTISCKMKYFVEKVMRCQALRDVKLYPTQSTMSDSGPWDILLMLLHMTISTCY